ncbi:hypothetical protein [Nocardioides montaniterrae]
MSAPHPGIEEPILPALERVLRRAVADHQSAERRVVFPSTLHSGFPGGPHRTLVIAREWRLDHALRVDMVQAITRAHLAGGQVPLLWLTRPEERTGHDHEWSAAAHAAGAELGVRLDLVIVTKSAWHDPHTGAGRAWTRMRRR